MSHYATEIKKATCYIHSSDFETVRKEIQSVVNRDGWSHYGWHDEVLKATTLEEILSEFDIRLVNEYGNYYRPVIEDVYVSNFFDALIQIVANYMTNGKIKVDDEYGIVVVKFKDGVGTWKYKEEK